VGTSETALTKVAKRMRATFRAFIKERGRHLLWGAVLSAAVSTVVCLYLIDFEHRYDEHFCDTTRHESETDEGYQKRLNRERQFYKRHQYWEFFENLELKLYDMHFRSRGRLPVEDNIVIVAIDTPSFSQMNIWPWPRSVYGKVLQRLHKAGAKVIAFDVLFSDPSDAEEDGSLSKAIKGTPGKVILSGDFDEEERDDRLTVSAAFPITEFDEFARDVGITRMPQDSDNFIRSFVVYLEHLEPADTPTGEAWNAYPSFATAVAGAYLNLPPEQVRKDIKEGRLGKARIPIVRNIRDKERSLHAYLSLMNFAGPSTHFRTHSFFEVMMEDALSDADLKQIFNGKIVLIGASAPILHDIFPTPFMDYGQTPGVEIHANAIHNLLTRGFIRSTALPTNLSAVFLLSLLTALLTITVSKPVSRAATLIDAKLAFSVKGFRVGTYSIVWFLLYFGGGLLPPAWGYWTYSFTAFRLQNLWVPLAYPLIAMCISYLLCVAYMFLTEEQEKKKMHSRFQRFVAPTVLTEILAHPTEEYPKARRVDATLVFTDLQGFTTLSEANEPEVVVQVLNEYLTRMSKVVFKYQGTIDKYIGDAIMVIFGAPVPFPDHAERAIRTAVEMQEACAEFREYGRTQGWPDFYMRVGVHSGRPMVGSVGSEYRLDYTAIGDDVNLAARLEGINKQYGSWVMCSSVTHEIVKDLVISEFVPAAQVKGKTSAVDIFKVLGLKEVGRRDDIWGAGSDKTPDKKAYGANIVK